MRRRGSEQQRTEALERRDGAEVVDRDRGGALVSEPRVGDDCIDRAAAERPDLLDEIGPALGGREVDGDVGVADVDPDDPVSALLEKLLGRAADA